ncbi:hypothetical protein NP493_453g02008 [Ridgeia piscesae]|uniref:medium-chain acyl-CoA ligase n=1 Tax=Ridgeia piscesae TaxID=27915 RepID=A0AAD9NTL8_RIDPI|nr:hypothetical protein NP493_453g02008 [Ridgeia piscesae]
MGVKTRSCDPLQIFFTSGTTGEPKMTEQTHASYGLASVITGKYWLDLTPSDVHWNLSDTGWAKSAWSSVFAPWIQGACVFVHHTPKFNPERVLETYPISTFCAAPTAYRMLVLENLTKYNLSSIRHCVSGGEPLNPEVIDQWLDATGTEIREGYGQTETVLLCASFRCLPNKPGSMGKPAPGMDVRVIDTDCREVDPGVEGDIAIRVSPERPVGLFSCYVNEPKKTAATYRGDYYLTGDRAYRDDDGYLWFVGRSDDIILSAGYRIGPFEVESALLEHPAVVESAVVSSPHTTRGEVVKAFVVLRGDYESVNKDALTAELQQMVKDVTAPYKYPRKVQFVESLPKTISGKIRRIDLRRREWDKQQ